MWKYVLLLMIGCIGCSKSGIVTNYDGCGFESGTSSYLKICNIKATPTELEAVDLFNYDSQAYTLTNWKLCDQNAYEKDRTGCKSLSSVIINGKTSANVGNLPFTINDTGETIYLLNESGQIVHSRSN